MVQSTCLFLLSIHKNIFTSMIQLLFYFLINPTKARIAFFSSFRQTKSLSKNKKKKNLFRPY
jgi:hypothetical protein